MKALGVILLLILILFIGFQLYSTMSTKKTEQYPYEVLTTYPDFEIRQYESRLFTTIKLNSNKYEEVSGKGFSALAGYIFGGNEKKEKIAMTSPVAMSLGDSMTMMFMVPRDLDESVLPVPDNKNIQFKTMPPQKVAAIRFGGWSSSDKIETYKRRLIEALEKEKISFKPNFFYLGYNPPYELVNRRNEIIVELNE